MSLTTNGGRALLPALGTVLITAALGSPSLSASPPPASGASPRDPLSDLCTSVSLEELDRLTGFRFSTAVPGPQTCTYASAPGADDTWSLELRIEGGQVGDLERSLPGGRSLEIAGRPSYWAGTALWTDLADGLFTVQPLVLDPGVDLLALAIPVAELALSRIGPPLVDAAGAFSFEDPVTTPSACYGEDAWTDVDGHRISGVPVTIDLTVHHLRDATDQLWLIVEGFDYLGVQPTLIGTSWDGAAWSHAFGQNTLVVPGPVIHGAADVTLQWQVVLRSIFDVPYEVRVTAGPPAEPRPDDGTLDAIVRAPDVARWERLVSTTFC